MNTSYFKNIVGHFLTITKHKHLVQKLMFKIGLPLQGLRHDLSKYSPAEFLPGVRYYQGFRSPNAQEREIEGYSKAWLHHKGRNKHHFEYWIDIVSTNNLTQFNDAKNPTMVAVGAIMPTRYVCEMFCDRVAASKIYQGTYYTDASALKYFQKECLNNDIIMHPETQKFILFLLTKLATDGEEATLDYIRNEIINKRYKYCGRGEF